MVNGNNSIVQLHDEIGTNSNGFFRIRTYDKSDLSDIDNDGISDSIELDSLGKFNPLNPAAPISITSGGSFYRIKKHLIHYHIATTFLAQKTSGK